MKAIFKNTLIAGSGFAGGILAGFLLSATIGDETLQQIQKKITGARQWLGKHNSDAHLRNLSSSVKNSFTNPLPDLYSATESFCLNEEDLIDG